MEDFSNMLPVMIKVDGVNENIVKVNHNANVEHICENSIDKTLESHQSIRKSKGHNQPLIGTIARAECGFPFITFTDVG